MGRTTARSEKATPGSHWILNVHGTDSARDQNSFKSMPHALMVRSLRPYGATERVHKDFICVRSHRGSQHSLIKPRELYETNRKSGTSQGREFLNKISLQTHDNLVNVNNMAKERHIAKEELSGDHRGYLCTWIGVTFKEVNNSCIWIMSFWGQLQKRGSCEWVSWTSDSEG